MPSFEQTLEKLLRPQFIFLRKRKETYSAGQSLRTSIFQNFGLSHLEH